MFFYRSYRHRRRKRFYTMFVLPFLVILTLLTPFYIIYKPPHILIRYFQRRWPDVLWHVQLKPNAAPMVALTIDDAPSEATPEIISLLAENDAKATFFVIGDHIAGREHILRDVVAGGNELANHAMYDEPSRDLSDDELASQIQAVQSRIQRIYAMVGREAEAHEQITIQGHHRDQESTSTTETATSSSTSRGSKSGSGSDESSEDSQTKKNTSKKPSKGSNPKKQQAKEQSTKKNKNNDHNSNANNINGSESKLESESQSELSETETESKSRNEARAATPELRDLDKHKRGEEQVLIETGGRYFRPGSGWFSDRMRALVQRLGYRLVLGGVYPHDPQIPFPWLNARHILSMVRPGSIIVIHDRRPWTGPMLAKLLPELKKRGYRVGTLTELLQESIS